MRKYLISIFLSFLLGGCGSSSGQFVAGPSQGGGVLTTLNGRLDLGTGIGGAPIEIRDLNGTLLASLATDSFGTFTLPNFEGPPDFQVVAIVGAGLEFSTEVRGYDSGVGRYVVINAPTTLVSRYLQGNPGETLAAAEDMVQDLLAFPPDRSLEYGVEESVRAPFSHFAFFTEAAAAGGWIAFRDQLVNQIGTGDVAGPFLLTRETASRPLGGLDPALAQAMQGLLATERLQNQLASGSAHPFPEMMVALTQGPLGFDVPAPNPRQLAAGEDLRMSVLSSIGKATQETLSGLPAEQIIDIGWTHIADALNLNYGTTTMLEEIQEQLNEVIDLLADLGTKLDDYNLQQASNSVNDDVATLVVLQGDLADVDATIISDPGTPLTPSSDVTTLLNALATFDAETALVAIQHEMLGIGNTTNILTSNRDNINNNLGLSADGSFGYAPVRSNYIVDQMMTAFDYYGGYQQAACTVIGENSHVTNADPHGDMVDADRVINQAAVSLKQQRGQLPQYLLSDNIVVDLQGGLMWYYQNQPAATFDQAAANASNFRVDAGNGVVWDDWRLPLGNEMLLLQDRGRLVATDLRVSSLAQDGSDSSYGNYGYTVQGLPALGFDADSLSIMGDGGSSWIMDWGYTSLCGCWMPEGGIEFRLNHETDNEEGKDSDDTRTYFYVRNIGDPLFVAPVQGVGYPFPYNPIQPGEFSTLGHLTELGFTEIVNGTAGTTATFTINIGGSFSMGGTEASDSRALQSLSYTHFVDTYLGFANPFAGPVDLLALIWFTPLDGNGNPDDSQLSVGTDGALFWHNDTQNTASSVPVQASVVSTNGNTLTDVGDFTANPVPVRQLVQVQMFPRNKKYDMTATSADNDKYYCLAYYSDNTVDDVTDQATWTVELEGGGVPTAAHFSTSTPNELVLSNAATENLTINVQFGQQTDTSSGEVYNS